MKPDHSPFLRHEQQLEFNMLAPFIQSRIRVVRLRRKGNAPLGFSIRGGCEHGTGVFISEVQVNSEAQRQGLRVGDQILRINGFNIDQAIHEEVLSLLKTKPGVVLKVKSVGMIPVKDKKKDPVTWKMVGSGGGGSGGQSPADSIVDGTNSYSGSSNYDEHQEVQVTLNIIGASGIGCTIVKGPPDTPGIFMQTVKPKSLAEAGGLQVGDQIVEMNGTSFLDVEFSQAVSLMKANKELRLTVRKAAGLDLFPEEKSRRAAAMLNGTSHTTKDERRILPVLNEEEERPRHKNGGLANGVIIAEIIQHPPPPSAQDVPPEGHQRQASSATTATVSERDVCISETNVPFTLDPSASTSSSLPSETSSPPSTPSLASMENGHDDVDRIMFVPSVAVERDEKRLPDEESTLALKREEERLAEERRKLEAEQAKLKAEAERLAQERKELDEERRMRLEAPAMPNIPIPPPPTPPLNFLHEIQNKQLTPMTPTSAADRARIRPLSVDSTKYKEEIIKRKQHEQLMQEFQKMHKKMFGADEKPPVVEEKEPEPPKTELSSFNFTRRQQVSVAPKPPPAISTGQTPVSRAISQPNLRQGDDFTDGEKHFGDISKGDHETTQPSAPTVGTEPKRSAVVPSKPILPVAVTTVTASAPNTPAIVKEPPAPVTSVVPEVNGHPPAPVQQASQPFPPLSIGGSTPITDSRGPVPKPPQTYFDTKKQKGPLVTIGVYPDNSRHNRFSNLNNEGVRNRQSQFESRSSSPSSSAPISVSMTSSSASSSATSSPHLPERKLANGQGSNPPVSFKVTYNSKTNASVNSITMNKSNPSQGTQNSLTFSLNGKSTPAKSTVPSTTNNKSSPSKPAAPKDPKDLFSPEELGGREMKVLNIPKTGPLNMKLSGGSGDPESGGRVVVSELWEGGCIGSKVDLKKGDQVLMVGDKSLLSIKLTLANVILRDAMSSTKEPLKLVIAREKK